MQNCLGVRAQTRESAISPWDLEAAEQNSKIGSMRIRRSVARWWCSKVQIAKTRGFSEMHYNRRDFISLSIAARSVPAISTAFAEVSGEIQMFGV